MVIASSPLRPSAMYTLQSHPVVFLQYSLNPDRHLKYPRQLRGPLESTSKVQGFWRIPAWIAGMRPGRIQALQGYAES